MTAPEQPPAAISSWPRLRVEAWPPKHRTAWQAAIRRENPLQRGGRAASLAPATRRTMTALYGQVLEWLRATGKLDPEGDPVTQITPELLGQFIAARRATLSDNTIFNNLRMLTMMLKCLEPAQEWRWVWRHSAAPRRSEARAARRPPRTFPAGLLLHRLVSAMQAVLELPVERSPRDRLRNCLLVALAVTSGLRLRNLAALRLGHNLIRRKAGWEILFDRAEVKNGEAILSQVPPALVPFLERYLAVDRPRLAARGAGATDALWVSCRGGPLSPQNIQWVFRRVGVEMLGYPINPHAARHVQATRILDDDPRALEIASLALAHSDISTVSQYYDQSGSQGAQAAWLELVAELQFGERQRRGGQRNRDRPA